MSAFCAKYVLSTGGNAVNKPDKVLGHEKFTPTWRRQLTSKETNKFLAYGDKYYKENKKPVME